jgi:carboxymethylenebutenolidase
MRKASDFHPDVLRLFDQYVHGVIDRRGFLDGAARFAGRAGAVALLAALSPRFARAQQVAPDDPRLRSERVQFPSPHGHGTGGGLFVHPATGGKWPAVVVAHENRGLNPHIEDVARRLALMQYAVIAPDALAPRGGYPGSEDTARSLFAQLDQTKTAEDFVAAAQWLKARPQSNGRLGAVGFCWGGFMVNTLATRLPDLAAAVPFYGSAPELERVPRMKAALLIQSADNDPGINAGWPAYEAALQRAGVRYERHLYPGTQHGFHNNTTPRYDERAAKLAWQRTLALFERTLR